MNTMTVNTSSVATPARRTGRIALWIGGGLLILFIGIGIGAYPNEKRLTEEIRNQETCKTAPAEMPGNLPAGTEIVIPLPSEDSYFADYRENALHITIDR